MKALVYISGNELEVQDMPYPVPNDEDAVVDVHPVGICSAEIEGIRSRRPFRIPSLVTSHEFAGIIHGSGERVVIKPIVSCRCRDLCLRGQGNLCRERRIIGVHRPSGFADAVLVPRSNLYAIPPGMTWEHAALVEPLANGVHGWRLVARLLASRVGGDRCRHDRSRCVCASRGGEASGRWRFQMCRPRGGRLGSSVLRAPGPPLRGSSTSSTTRSVPRQQGGLPLSTSVRVASRRGSASTGTTRTSAASMWSAQRSTSAGPSPITDADVHQALELATMTEPSFVVTFPLPEGAEVFTSLLEGRADIVKAQLVPEPAGSVA